MVQRSGRGFVQAGQNGRYAVSTIVSAFALPRVTCISLFDPFHGVCLSRRRTASSGGRWASMLFASCHCPKMASKAEHVLTGTWSKMRSGETYI